MSFMVDRPVMDLRRRNLRAKPANEPRWVLAHGTGVLTPRGWSTVEGLKAGNEVFTRVGASTQIDSKRITRQQAFKVSFSDGAEVVVGADHEWPVQSHNLREAVKRDGMARWETRSTSAVLSVLDRGETRSNYVPVIEPVQFSQEADLPLDPYGLGLMLGDGSFCSGTPSFTKPEPELHTALRRSFPRNSQTPIGRVDRGAIYLPGSGGTNVLSTGLRELGLWGHASHEKFVPTPYLLASPADRLAVLQGLLDTDGWVQRNSIGNTSAYFGTSSPELAADVVNLVESLGGLTTQKLRPAPRFQSGIGKPAFVIRVRLPEDLEPFRLSRKLEAWRSGRTSKRTPPVRSIKSVEPIGTHLCYTIRTASPEDGLVLARFIAT